MAPVVESVSDTEKQVFELISINDINGLKTLFMQERIAPDIFDDHGMTPLQHASYKGNKDIAQMLLDQGANPNSGRHDHGYTALHFAALSGNCELCIVLLTAGAKNSITNSVGRTPSQMAAFVGNHDVVAVINNFVPKSEIDFYTIPNGLENEPKLPPVLAYPLHKFIMQVNVHPIRVALNLQPALMPHLKACKNVLEIMCTKEMRRTTEINEVMAFKLHYLGFVIGEIMRCSQPDKNTDSVEVFAKKILRTGRGEEFLERFIRDCVREFPFRECALFRQMVSSLADPEEAPPALIVLYSSINGQRAFNDDPVGCSTCGELKPPKKCSKCKKVQYCDRECQRLHWFAHKKECERPVSSQLQNLSLN